MLTKLIIAGGRNAVMTDAQWRILTNVSDLIDEVVSGGATGIDSWGELWAGRNKKPCHKFPADWKRLGQQAGSVRNSQMAAYANALAIFDGGRGSADMLMQAIAAGLWIWDFRSNRDKPCVVVNRHETDDYNYYGGRGSILGNPYDVETYGRTRAIELFRQHAMEDEVLQRAIPYLRGMRIACSCKPKPCHLDCLAEMANEGLVCADCGGSGMTPGWYPTYNNPDNHDCDEPAQPCGTCKKYF